MPARAGTVDASTGSGVMSPAARPAIDWPEKACRRKGKTRKSLSAKTSSHGTMPLQARQTPIPVRSSSRAPWKSPHAGDAPLSMFVSSLSPPVTSHQHQTSRLCPAAVPGRCCRSSAQQPSDAGSNEPETHLVDEAFGGEEYAAEKSEPAKNTWRERACNIFSPRRGRTRVTKFDAPHLSSSKRLKFRTFGRRDSCRRIGEHCSKKNLPRSTRTRDSGVTSVTMTLTHCHTCAFLARFS